MYIMCVIYKEVIFMYTDRLYDITVWLYCFLFSSFISGNLLSELTYTWTDVITGLTLRSIYLGRTIDPGFGK